MIIKLGEKKVVLGGIRVSRWPRRFCRPRALVARALAFDMGSQWVARHGDMFGYMNPAQNQKGPSCGGNALANAIEVLLRRCAPEEWLHNEIQKKLGHLRWQIDGYRIWREIRNSKYGGTSGGVRMEDILDKFRDMDVVPSAKIEIIPPGDTLARDGIGAIVCGFAVAPTWRRPNPNGYIQPLMPWPNSGHAVMIPCGWLGQGTSKYVVIQNSWGGSWGWHGLGILHERFAKYSMIDFAFIIRPPDGQWWEGLKWLDYVIPHEEADYRGA